MRLILAAALVMTSCDGAGDTETDTPAIDPYDVQVGPYQATVRWTAHGVPHVVADNHGSLSFAYGYVQAKHHACTLADMIVKVRGERSMYFGAGTNNANVDSDLGWLHLSVRQHAEQSFVKLDADLQASLVGFAAGYNKRIAEPGALPDACAGASWVKPIDHIDLYSYHFSMGQWGSGLALLPTIGQAQPPQRDGGDSYQPIAAPPLDILTFVREPDMGSNGWAIGGDHSSTGKGALLSNTHFPTFGERQWHEVHLTIPNEYNVYGAALIGMPFPAMGFNEHLAWTHTVSNTPRFTPYLLKLQPGDPTTYRYGDGWEKMVATDYTVQVKQDDGSLKPLNRTLYASHFGPIWNAPVVGWNGLQAMAYRDVNWNNDGLLSTFHGMGQAKDIEQFKSAHRDHQGIPWVHTMYADDQGNAMYLDSSAAPNISPDTWKRYDDFVAGDFFAKQFQGFGLTVLDGTDPLSEWSDDDRAARPGTVAFDDCPQIVRRDFVSNANQNHWMANPEQPLTGLPRIYGNTGTVRTPRTRMNNYYLQGTGDAPERGDDGKWTLEEIETAAMSMRSSIAELVLDDVIDRCQSAPATLSIDGADVPMPPICDVLDGWDARGNVHSVGAHLWREFLGSDPIKDTLYPSGTFFDIPFDPANPINTPRGLAAAPAEGPDPIHVALATASKRLTDNGFDLDSTLGDVQVRLLGDETHATPGGASFEGYIGIASWGTGGKTTLAPLPSRGTVINGGTGLASKGYVINNGNSWMMTVQFDDDGPAARALMVYSQSEDPKSEYFSDQTELYAEQSARPALFTESDIAADPKLVTETLTYP